MLKKFKCIIVFLCLITILNLIRYYVGSSVEIKFSESIEVDKKKNREPTLNYNESVLSKLNKSKMRPIIEPIAHELPSTIEMEAIQTTTQALNKSNKSEKKCMIPKYDYNGEIPQKYLKKAFVKIAELIESCPVNNPDSDQLDQFIMIKSHSTGNSQESYQVTLNMSKIAQSFNLNQSYPTCTLQKFSKKLGIKEHVSEKGILFRKHIQFSESQNYSMHLNESGYYYLKCNNNSEKIFDYIYTILPLNMTRLRDKRIENIRNVEDFTSRLNDSMLTKDLDFKRCSQDMEFLNKTDRFNVLMIGIDSISNFNMRRIFPLTYSFLNEKLKNNLIYENFNSIGENTYPNHLAMLTGIASYFTEFNLGGEMDYMKKVQNDETFHDHYPFIWKQFEKLGYISMVQTDMPGISMFNYLKKGFKYEAADFYNRAFSVKYSKMRSGPSKCHYKKPTFQTLFDQIKMFVNQMNSDINRETPYFSFNFIAEYTHDDLAVPPDMDKQLRNLLESFNEKDYLKNTLLMIYGDHGNRLTGYSRYTEIGRFERNRPFFSMKLPDQFENTDYIKNALKNKEKLITFFDVYQTLRQISFMEKYRIRLDKEIHPSHSCRMQFRKNVPEIRSLRGISLLENIHDRSCKEALVETKRCNCFNEQILSNEELLELTGYSFKNASHIVLQYINTIFDKNREQCEIYKFEKFESFKLIKKEGKNVFICILIASPGDAWFETYLNIDKHKKLVVRDAPLRMSPYGDQSSCINDTFYKKYCFCKKH